MPAPFPKEFREDVIRVAKSREPGVTIAQIAKDFGIHPGTLDNWLRTDRVDAGEQAGTTTTEAAEVRELRKRNRLLEQENEVLRRAAAYFAQAHLSGK
ncbi:transposase [Microbacterium maritypicum]